MDLPFSFPDASAPLLSSKYFWPPFAKDWIISGLKYRAKTPYCMYLCVPCRFSGKLAHSWQYTLHHLLGSHSSPDFKKIKIKLQKKQWKIYCQATPHLRSNTETLRYSKTVRHELNLKRQTYPLMNWSIVNKCWKKNYFCQNDVVSKIMIAIKG